MPEDTTDQPVERFPVSDDELTELAMMADPDAPIDPDAIPFTTTDGLAVDLLPSWYMPAPSLRRSRGRTVVLAGVAASLLLINVMGLCVTYGFPEPVW